MSNIVEVGIHYSVAAEDVQSTFSQIEANARKFGQNMATITGGMSAQSSSNVRKFAEESTRHFGTATQASKDFTTQAGQHIRSYSELAQEYSKKTTNQLVADIQKNIIAINDERRQRIEAAQSGNTAEAKVHQQRLQRIQSEQNALRSLAAQRQEVIRAGAGTSVGILGIGREVVGSVPGLGRATELLSGLQAYRVATDGIGKSSALAAIKLAGIGAAGYVAYKGLKETIDVGREFDSEFTKSTAIMGNLTEDTKKRMIKAAQEAGAATNFEASEMAKAYFHLASAGLDANQAIEALPVVARFAKAGMFDLSEATQYAVQAQSALGMRMADSAENARQLARVTDVLATANNNADGTLEEFSQALTNKSGAALKMVNKDIEEGVAVLAAYAHQGTKGAEAGEALSIVLRDLQKDALKNADAWKQNNIAVFDSTGKMRNMADIIGDLEKRMNGMSDAQKKMLLMQLGFSEKSIAYTQELIGTSDEIRKYEQVLRKAGGTTQEVADKQMQSLDEKAKQLSITLHNDLITAFLAMEPELIKAVEDLTSLAHGLGEVETFVGRAASKIGELETAIHALNPELGGILDKIHSIPGFIASMPGGQPLAALLAYGQLSDAEKAQSAKNSKVLQGLSQFDSTAGKGNLGTSIIDANGDPILPHKGSFSGGMGKHGKGGGGNAAGKAFGADRDAASDQMAEAIAEYMKLGHTAEEINQYRLQLQLETDTKIYEAAVVHGQRSGQLHEKVMNDRLALQKLHDDQVKKISAQSAKDQQGDFKNVTDQHNDELQKRLNALEENAAAGVISEKEYNRQVLVERLQTSQQILDDAKFLGVNILTSEKAENAARHALRVFDLKDAQATSKQMQDAEAQRLQDQQDRWQAQQDSITSIVQSGADNMLAGLKGGFFDPVQQQLGRTQNGFTRFMSGILGDLDKTAQQMVSKTLQFGALKLLAPNSPGAQGGLLDFLGFGGSKDTSTGTAAKAKSPQELLGMLANMGLPGFEDSGAGRYTGGTPGQAVGIVHGGEVVTGATAVSAFGGPDKLSSWIATGLALQNGGFMPTGAVIEGANGGRFIDQQGQLPESYRKAKYSGFKKRESEAHTIPSEQLDKMNQDLYYQEKGGFQESLHNFFGSINGTLNSASTKIANFVKDTAGNPLVGFGVGSTNMLSSGPMALVDRVFGTHSHEGYVKAISQMKGRAGLGGTSYNVGQFGGEVSGAVQIDDLMGAAGLTGGLSGAATGFYGTAGESNDKLNRKDYLGAAVNSGLGTGLGFAFAKGQDFAVEKLETSGNALSERIAKHLGGATEHTAESGFGATEFVHPAYAEEHKQSTQDTTSKMKELAETTTAAKNALAGLTGSTNKLVKGGAQKGLSTGSKLLGVASLFTHIIDPTGTTAGILGDIGGLFGATAGLATGGVLHLAAGDIVRGPGTTTSDSILARLSNREGVINARGVSNMGEDLIHGMNSGAITRDHFMPRAVQLEHPGSMQSVQQNFHLSMGPVVDEIRSLKSAIASMQINIDRSAIRDGVNQAAGKSAAITLG